LIAEAQLPSLEQVVVGMVGVAKKAKEEYADKANIAVGMCKRRWRQR